LEAINDALYGFTLTWNSSLANKTLISISVHDNGNTGFDGAPGPNNKRSVEADLSDSQQFMVSANNPTLPIDSSMIFDPLNPNFNGVILLVNGWIGGSLMQKIGVPVQIQVNRPDLLSTEVMLRLWCGNDGLLTLNTTDPGLTLQSWPSQLRLSGRVSTLQSVLYGLNYQPKGLFCGADKIFVEMNDVQGHPLMSNAIEVTVLCIASPPELLVNDTIGEEDKPLELPSLQVNPSNPGQVVGVELYNVPEGFKVVPAHYDAARKRWNLQLKNVAKPNTKIVSLTQKQVLRSLTRVQMLNPDVVVPNLNPKFVLDFSWDSTPRIVPPPNFNGQITINITATGQQKGIPSDVMTSKLVTLTFAPVNDAPSIFTPLHLFVRENLDTPVNKITIAPPFTQNSIQFSDLDLTPAQYSDPNFIFTLKFRPGQVNGPWWSYVLLMDTATGTWTVGDHADVIYNRT
jgi:hypothetical protein